MRQVKHLGGGGHWQDDKKSRCSLIRNLPLPIARSEKVIFGDNSYGQVPSLNS